MKGGRIGIFTAIPLFFIWIAASAALLPDDPGTVRRYAIFGKDQEEVTLRDNRLQHAVYYIVSGHGGPDSGAQGERDGNTLCEDEYAYDVALRLARKLLEHDAKVYLIVRDPDDGIRDDSLLICDTDETVWGGKPIPLGQLDRLEQRASIVNRLSRHNSRYRYQRLIVLHVDSRQEGDRVDIFFYHHSTSTASLRTATVLQETIEDKYGRHQPWRGYQGTVAARDGLYMLRNTRPRTVYIELGNIRNPLDQRRFTSVDNRQALANWLTEG
ncbi:MAG: N-acetylmuramoyl-L-alanine amidase, partial [Bacteroidetes bacterium]|nr:N-acetylmuramoyl-L-alanine amidase [Bacteroidota bacterium]